MFLLFYENPRSFPLNSKEGVNVFCGSKLTMSMRS